MTTISKDQFVQLARMAGLSEFIGNDRVELGQQLQALAQAAFKLGRNDGLEAVSDAWSDAVHSDLENGVKVLNEIAAKKLRKFYPEICNFGEVIESLKDNNE